MRKYKIFIILQYIISLIGYTFFFILNFVLLDNQLFKTKPL
jgi:hypothetical protein